MGRNTERSNDVALKICDAVTPPLFRKRDGTRLACGKRIHLSSVRTYTEIACERAVAPTIYSGDPSRLFKNPSRTLSDCGTAS